MSNPYLPKLATIKEIELEAPDIKTFRVALNSEEEHKNFSYSPGQFAQISVFGTGEAPFCINSTPTRPGPLEFSIKKMGRVTSALHEMEPGDLLGVRGPYGNGFPIEEMRGKNLIFIGGGIGLAPLRSLINYAIDKKEEFGQLLIIYGARSPQDLVYKRELESWRKEKGLEVRLTVDKGDETWEGNVGFVPAFLLDIGPSPENAVAITCGPPIMIKFVLQNLLQLGFKDEQIITTLEMKMKCGLGKCGRCNIGEKFVCLDGPVFSYKQLRELPAEF